MSKIPYIISIVQLNNDTNLLKISNIQGVELKDDLEETVVDKLLDMMLEKQERFNSFEQFLHSFFNNENIKIDNEIIEVKFFDSETECWYDYLTNEIKTKIYDIYDKIYSAIHSPYISNKIIEICNKMDDEYDDDSTIQTMSVFNLDNTSE